MFVSQENPIMKKTLDSQRLQTTKEDDAVNASQEKPTAGSPTKQFNPLALDTEGKSPIKVHSDGGKDDSFKMRVEEGQHDAVVSDEDMTATNDKGGVAGALPVDSKTDNEDKKE